MTTEPIDADRIVKAYVKLRDAKAQIMRDAEEKAADLQDKLNQLERVMLDLCESTGQDGGKTAHGTFTRTVKTRYESTNWAQMYEFIRAHDMPELLEQRIHQTNMKQFLQEHPGVLPEGMNVNSRYAITVRRASK